MSDMGRQVRTAQLTLLLFITLHAICMIGCACFNRWSNKYVVHVHVHVCMWLCIKPFHFSAEGLLGLQCMHTIMQSRCCLVLLILIFLSPPRFEGEHEADGSDDLTRMVMCRVN